MGSVEYVSAVYAPHHPESEAATDLYDSEPEIPFRFGPNRTTPSLPQTTGGEGHSRRSHIRPCPCSTPL